MLPGPYYQLPRTLTWAIIWGSPFDNTFSLNFSKMSVFSASPQCFSLAHDGEIFQVPLFHFFPFGCYMPWASLLCLSYLPLSSSIFFLDFFGKDLCFIMLSFLLPAPPPLGCHFHHFKVIALLLVHFGFGFPYFVVWWLCLATYSLLPACWIHSLGSIIPGEGNKWHEQKPCRGNELGMFQKQKESVT